MRRHGLVALVALVALFAPLLAGCPGVFGFRGQLYAPRAPGAKIEVLAVARDLSNRLASDELAPVPNAQVTCEGCGPKPIVVDANGRFDVMLGQGYHPPPIVLHVRAPGYRPIDLDVPDSGGMSQVGYPSLTLVMTPDQPK
jgi:hypothetical protein